MVLLSEGGAAELAGALVGFSSHDIIIVRLHLRLFAQTFTEPGAVAQESVSTDTGSVNVARVRRLKIAALILV